MIRYLKHKQIDKIQWDACVDEASNNIIYAYSWYLDIVSPHWDALVIGDYDFVMPLPVKKYIGLTYLVRPPLCQQLGIFSKETVTQEIQNEFLQALNFVYVFVSFYQVQAVTQKNILVTESPNFVLSLSAEYDEIAKCFSDNTRRNIKKAQKNGVEIRLVKASEYLSFISKHIKGGSHALEKILSQLLSVCLSKNKCECWGAYSSTGELLAVDLFLISSNRYINFVPASNQEGIEKSAMFLLVSSFIKSHAQSDAILDFEGSRIEGVARFYKGFGAENQPYFFVQKIKFPQLFGLIKYLQKKLFNL